MTKKFELLAYALIPIILFCRIGFNAICTTIATLLDGDKRYDFTNSFSICLKTEVVFIGMLIMRIIILMFRNVKLLDDLTFTPFSLLDLIPPDRQLPRWSHYALSNINVWEIFFCFLGMLLFARVYKTDRKTAAKLFVLPYIGGLLFVSSIATFLMIEFY